MIELLVILGCMTLSFLFSGLETGVLLLNRVRIRHLKERGSLGARILLEFMHHPDRLSSTVLVGNTLANGAATVLVAQRFLQTGGPVAAVGAVAVFAMALWYFCEMVPKHLFRRFPNRLTSRLTPVLLVSYVILWPLVRGFALFSRVLVASLGGKISSKQMFVSRDELKLMARETEEGAPLTGEQRNLVASILEKPNATIRDFMKPRSEVVTVRESMTEEERERMSVTSRFSRLPIEGSDASAPWKGLWVTYDSIFHTIVPLRNPPRLLSSAHLEEVLPALRQARSPLAFVKDREGHDIGIITIEDVMRRYLGKVDL